jgi:adenine-specific DNA-methyltransferase
LNHRDTLENLQAVGKSYGSGAIKVEPNSLKNLAIPDHIVMEYHLCRADLQANKQYNLF